MRTRVIFLVLLGLVFAGAATFLVLKRVAPPPQQAAATAATAPTGPATVELLVALRDLPSGYLIGPADVQVVDWPRGSLPEGGMAPGSIAFGQTLVRLPVARNSPVLQNQIIFKGDGGHLAYLLEQGRVAATISISETSGVAGHVAPGDFVDVLFTHELGNSLADTMGASGGAEASATETLLVRIKVIAADQRVDDVNAEARVGRTVTLEVSPKEAEMLALAQEMGQLSLTLNSASQPEVLDREWVLQVRGGPLTSYTLDNDISPLLKYARATARETAAAAAASTAEEAPVAEGEDEEEGPKPHVVIVMRGATAEEVAISPAPGLEAEESKPGKTTKGGSGKPAPIDRSNTNGEARQ